MRLHACAIATALLIAAAAASTPALAQAPPVQQASHPNGVTLLVRSVTPRADGIVVAMDAINGNNKDVQLNYGRSMKLLDGQTGFNLSPPLDNPTLRVPPSGRLSGEFFFIGFVRPGTREVTLTMNDGVGGSRDNRFTAMPVFTLRLPVPEQVAAPAPAQQPGPLVAVPTPVPSLAPPTIPVPDPAPAATAAAPAPAPRGLPVQASHANGSSIVVTSVTANVDSIVVGLDALNGSDNDITLNHSRSMVLKDDRGSTYRLNAPLENATLVVPRGSRVQASLVFIGRLPPGVGQLVLSTNDGVGGSRDSRFTRMPVFELALPVPATVGDAGSGAGLPGSTAQTVAIALSTATAAAAGPGSAPSTGVSGGSTVTVGQVEQSRAATVQELRSALGAVDEAGGTRITLSGDVLFDFDRDTIRADAQTVLARVGSLIRETRPAGVQVEGHTDARGADSYNQDLSERRARSVAAWLGREAGVPVRFTERGYGETRPASANTRPDGSDDPEGRQRNRRVEILLLRG